MAKIQGKSLLDLYEIASPGETLAYLAKYPELELILIDALPQIHKYFGDAARAYLKLEFDVEEHFDILCVYILSSLNPAKTSEQLHLLDEEWFVHEMPRLKGNLLFDIEF